MSLKYLCNALIHWFLSWFCLYQRTKIQILKAIHNALFHLLILEKFISKNKDTNFESNSQLIIRHSGIISGLYQRTKIQILKAIHNCAPILSCRCKVYIKEQRYKFWKQFTTSCLIAKSSLLFISKNKDTNFESNSQLW